MESPGDTDADSNAGGDAGADANASVKVEAKVEAVRIAEYRNGSAERRLTTRGFW